jgi:hypothetical protein
MRDVTRDADWASPEIRQAERLLRNERKGEEQEDRDWNRYVFEPTNAAIGRAEENEVTLSLSELHDFDEQWHGMLFKRAPQASLTWASVGNARVSSGPSDVFTLSDGRRVRYNPAAGRLEEI